MKIKDFRVRALLWTVAAITAVLTAIGKLPTSSGLIGVLVTTAAALIAIPVTEIIKKQSDRAHDQRVAMKNLQRTGAVLKRRIKECDPIHDLRVHPPIEHPDGPRLPPYIPRSADDQITSALASGGLIVIEGSSGSGKTRAAYEALLRSREEISKRPLYIPRDGVALREFVESNPSLSSVIVWLDDLERFLTPDGLDEGLLVALCPPERTDVLIMATLRSSSREALGSSEHFGGVDTYNLSALRVLTMARSIRIRSQFNDDELRRAQLYRDDPRIAAALDDSTGAGVAEFLAAGPAIVDRWVNGKDAGHEVGSALISAAIDLRRIGYFAPLPGQWLVQLYSKYLDASSKRRAIDFDLNTEFHWASTPVLGASSCLIPTDGENYLVFDYLVDQVQRRTRSSGIPYDTLRSIPHETWHMVMDNIDPTDPCYLSVAISGAGAGHPILEQAVRHVTSTTSFDSLFDNYQTAAAKQHQAPNTGQHARPPADLDSLFTDHQVLALTLRCIDQRMCVTCAILMLGLDLARFIRVSLEAIEPRLNEDHPVHSSEMQGIVEVLRDLGDNGPDRDGSPIGEACKTLESIRLTRLGILLLSFGALTSGTAWLRYAALAGDTDAQSALQDQLELDIELPTKDWRDCGLLTTKSALKAGVFNSKYPDYEPSVPPLNLWRS